MRQKLAYEWKQVYRALNLQDAAGTGKVNAKIFERIVHEHKVFLAKEDLLFIYRKYSITKNPEEQPSGKEIEY